MHHFIDFKSFRRARIRLIRPLTILVGPNGSGKSNALEGIEVLASIAAGDPLREITDLDPGRVAKLLSREIGGSIAGASLSPRSGTSPRLSAPARMTRGA
ncbi:MAG: ATP-binding protein [Gemmatimonadetes bacterium]|nr:ATP-binding protein [Gemmatimonadota bacterium]MYD12982.1 ATP-binding protein [Gemmatimonadota bacterium]MYI66587.1 ATP-binding protein [Gemmatimonadota bacterium]